MRPQDNPSLMQFVSHLTSDPNSLEIIRQPLFDSIVYPTAGSAAPFNFFSVPIGQGTSSSSGNAANPKSLADTNMQLAGALGQPLAFWVDEIEFDIQPGSVATTPQTYVLVNPITTPLTLAAIAQGAVADVNAIGLGGVVKFSVNVKDYYIEQPLMRFPTQKGFALDGFTSATAAIALPDLNGATRAWQKMRSVGYPAQINPGVAIAAQQPFGVTLQYPTAIATPSGFNARVTCYLNGWLIRPVQ